MIDLPTVLAYAVFAIAWASLLVAQFRWMWSHRGKPREWADAVLGYMMRPEFYDKDIFYYPLAVLTVALAWVAFELAPWWVCTIPLAWFALLDAFHSDGRAAHRERVRQRQLEADRRAEQTRELLASHESLFTELSRAVASARILTGGRR